MKFDVDGQTKNKSRRKMGIFVGGGGEGNVWYDI
jgi:hypothetical protein